MDKQLNKITKLVHDAAALLPDSQEVLAIVVCARANEYNTSICSTNLNILILLTTAVNLLNRAMEWERADPLMPVADKEARDKLMSVLSRCGVGSPSSHEVMPSNDREPN